MARGFTLIELSIVLVVIGLIVGGVLVGQDLIRAAQVRATITQVEKFNTAANTFYGKYRALPGDMNASTATTYGFTARGAFAGEGDGNGIIQGVVGNAGNNNYGRVISTGETAMFWVDLSSNIAGNLIEGGFNTASETNVPSADITGTQIQLYLPAAKIGNGNYFYVYSGDAPPGSAGLTTGINYIGLSDVSNIGAVSNSGQLASTANLSVATAYNIDKKMDDGLPQSGNVMAWYLNTQQYWTDGTDATLTANEPTPYAGALPGSATTCYDNNNTAGGTTTYSTKINNGAGGNCALSFKMQAGD